MGNPSYPKVATLRYKHCNSLLTFLQNILHNTNNRTETIPCTAMSLLPLLLLLLPTLSTALFLPHPPQVLAEGVTHARGSLFFFGDLRTGSIYLADLRTRLTVRAVQPLDNRTAVGLHALPDKNLLFAAGAGRPFVPRAALHVYNISTGDQLASCPISDNATLINDVVANPSFAYYTDSILGRIYRLSLRHLPRCVVRTINLPRPFRGRAERASANGLVLYKGGLIVVHFERSTIFFVDLRNRNKLQRILPDGALGGADGLALERRGKRTLLFVAQNVENQVSVWRLSMNKRRKVAVKFAKKFTDPRLKFPTTVAVSDEFVVATSDRLNEQDFFEPVPENVTLGLVAWRR